MTAIWRNDGAGWGLLPAIGFADKAALHDPVEEAQQLLPLAANPRLVVVGREVRLGPGSADLIAIEPSGRPVVIEVKLAYSNEARVDALTDAYRQPEQGHRGHSDG
jgi:RecB family endonuclease NucS